MSDQDTNVPSATATVRPDTIKRAPETVIVPEDAPKKHVAKPKFTKPTTYRANADGFLSGESHYIRAGEIFTTTAPKGEWMDEISDAELTKMAKAQL